MVHWQIGSNYAVPAHYVDVADPLKNYVGASSYLFDSYELANGTLGILGGLMFTNLLPAAFIPKSIPKTISVAESSLK